MGWHGKTGGEEMLLQPPSDATAYSLKFENDFTIKPYYQKSLSVFFMYELMFTKYEEQTANYWRVESPSPPSVFRRTCPFISFQVLVWDFGCYYIFSDNWGLNALLKTFLYTKCAHIVCMQIVRIWVAGPGPGSLLPYWRPILMLHAELKWNLCILECDSLHSGAFAMPSFSRIDGPP